MKHILIIEPNKEELIKISEVISNSAYKVTAVSKGSSGVQKALETIPNLIICNSNSYDLSGYDIYNTLKQINSTAVIPFIFSTDNSSYEEIRTVMELDVDDYIIKPLNLVELLALVEKKLEKQKKISSVSDNKFSTLMDHSPSAVFIYQENMLTYVNQKFCEIVQYSKLELLGMSLVNIIYKDDIGLVIEKMNRCFSGIENELQVQFRILGGDQKLFTINFSGSIVSVDEKKNIIGNISKEEVKESTSF